jgi:hypothetical protein
MASDLLQPDTEASGAAESRRGKGLSQRAMWPESLSELAPWSKMSWGLFVPLVFAGNVVVATLAWFIVELVMR